MFQTKVAHFCFCPVLIKMLLLIYVERDMEIEIEIEIERSIDRETEREREREGETDRQTERERERERYGKRETLRGPAGILFISRDACSDSTAKLSRACFHGVSHNYHAICCRMGLSHRCACVKLSTKGGVSHYIVRYVATKDREVETEKERQRQRGERAREREGQREAQRLNFSCMAATSRG